MKKLLTLFCFIPFIFFSQEGPDSTYIIRDAGFSVYDDYDKVRDSIASKNWNIQYWTVGNCTVSFEFQDSIKIMNNNTYKNLAIKYGEDWEKRFKAEVDTVYNKLIYDRQNVILIKDTIENENFYIEYTRNYYGSKNWFTLYSKKGLSSSNFSVQKIDNSSKNYIFRGIDNEIFIEFPFKKDTTKYFLSYENIGVYSIELIDSSNLLYLKARPGISKSAKVEIKNDLGLDTTLIFTIINLPKPILCLNITKDGERINKKAARFELSLKEPEEFNFNFTYDILSWYIFSTKEKQYVGKGSSLSKDAEDYIKSLKKGTKFSITIQVKGPINQSDVVRKVSGEFIIE
ncbi:MAG: hypothetical protein ACK476_02670 [Fluviicola sp.]